MTERAVLDVSGLSTHAERSHAPIWWGQLGMMMIETTIFAILIASYFYVRAQFAVWPPPNISPPDLTISSIGVLILLVSAIPMYLSDQAAKKRNRPRVILYMSLNLALGLIFLALRWMEFLRFNFKWSTDIYGSFFWCTVGLHTMHAIADLIQTMVMLAIVLVRRVGEKQLQGIEVDGLYWYFIVAIWIPVWIVFFLYPNMLKS